MSREHGGAALAGAIAAHGIPARSKGCPMTIRLSRGALLLALGLAATALSAGEAFDGRVVGVSDGDTVTVLRNGHDQVRIRLSGIDVPELHQAFGRQAKDGMSRLAFGRNVSVRVVDHDRYRRTVARLAVDGQDVGLTMLRQGLAWHYKHYDSDPVYASAENTARAQRLGLWADPHPVAPWDYRHGGGSATTSPAAAAAVAADGMLHGNESSHVYHRPGCPQYNCRRCTRGFKTDQEAQAAGFRQAGCCAKR